MEKRGLKTRPKLPTTREALARKLRLEREEVDALLDEGAAPRGLSRVKIAKRLRVNVMTVYRMLRGEGSYRELFANTGTPPQE